MERAVADLQLSVMQEFFKIRMIQAYGANWISYVGSVVRAKFANNNQFKQNYLGIYNVIQNEGIENLNEKGMDITSITALIFNDFYDQCKIGTNFKQQVKNIQADKNRLVSHISDPEDILNVKILELTALKDIRSFLTYLLNSAWSYSGKQVFIDKYLAQIEEITINLFRDVAGADQEEIEFESTRVNYLNKLVAEREANLREYMPLAYKADDGSAQRYLLQDIDSLLTNQKGFVLFADAGYGKTWSVQELAGVCAKRALEDNSANRITPVLIKMGQLAPNKEPLLKAAQEYLFPGDSDLEKIRKYLQTEKVVLYVDGMDEADNANKINARKEMTRLLDTCAQLRIIGGTRECDKQQFPDNLPKYSICGLTDVQVKAFITKMITNEEDLKKALFDYFDNPATNFLKNLRSPFYLKCYIDFVKEGESDPGSDTDMMSRYIDKMIEREIKIKGFRASVKIVNEFLLKMSELLGEKRYIKEAEALKRLKEDLVYDTEEMASVVQIKDTLVELQILKEIIQERQVPIIGFGHEKYKDLYSPIANDTDMWDY